MSVYVFGHKNPDSDTVCSAIALADLKSKLGVACTPTAQGELVRKAGVMAVVHPGGPVAPGSHVTVVLPPEPHRPMERI